MGSPSLAQSSRRPSCPTATTGAPIPARPCATTGSPRPPTPRKRHPSGGDGDAGAAAGAAAATRSVSENQTMNVLRGGGDWLDRTLRIPRRAPGLAPPRDEVPAPQIIGRPSEVEPLLQRAGQRAAEVERQFASQQMAEAEATEGFGGGGGRGSRDGGGRGNGPLRWPALRAQRLGDWWCGGGGGRGRHGLGSTRIPRASREPSLSNRSEPAPSGARARAGSSPRPSASTRCPSR